MDINIVGEQMNFTFLDSAVSFNDLALLLGAVILGGIAISAKDKGVSILTGICFVGLCIYGTMPKTKDQAASIAQLEEMVRVCSIVNIKFEEDDLVQMNTSTAARKIGECIRITELHQEERQAQIDKQARDAAIKKLVLN